MTAPTYPLVATEFWSGLLAFVLFGTLIMIWAFVLTDLFVRRGMAGWKKAAWIFAIIFFPFAGAFLYLITRRPSKAEEAYYSQAIVDQATYIEGAATQLERLNQLRDTGDISEQEYQTLRAQIVAGRKLDRAA